MDESYKLLDIYTCRRLDFNFLYFRIVLAVDFNKILLLFAGW